MSLDSIIGNFVKGLGSAVFQIGTLKVALSSAIAGGVEDGIHRAMPMLIKNIILGSIFLTGVFILGLGIAKWAESLFAAPGTGYVMTGIILLLAGSIYLALTSREAEK